MPFLQDRQEYAVHLVDIHISPIVLQNLQQNIGIIFTVVDALDILEAVFEALLARLVFVFSAFDQVGLSEVLFIFAFSQDFDVLRVLVLAVAGQSIKFLVAVLEVIV